MSRFIRKLLCALTIAALLAAPVCPALAASVSARVTSSSAKFYRYPTTASAHVSVKKGLSLTVTGVKNGWARVRVKGVTGYMKTSALGAAARRSSGSSWKKKVVRMNWFKGGSSVLKKGAYGYIYDIDTGITMRIKRMGGTNHADVEPATRSDTAKLLKIAGGHFSWNSHAVILHAGGKFVACAINTMPHGDQTITSNGYNGQFCLHMTGSKTHESNSTNSDHQAAIQRAYNWAH